MSTDLGFRQDKGSFPMFQLPLELRDMFYDKMIEERDQMLTDRSSISRSRPRLERVTPILNIVDFKYSIPTTDNTSALSDIQNTQTGLQWKIIRKPDPRLRHCDRLDTLHPLNVYIPQSGSPNQFAVELAKRIQARKYKGRLSIHFDGELPNFSFVLEQFKDAPVLFNVAEYREVSIRFRHRRCEPTQAALWRTKLWSFFKGLSQLPFSANLEKLDLFIGSHSAYTKPYTPLEFRTEIVDVLEKLSDDRAADLYKLPAFQRLIIGTRYWCFWHPDSIPHPQLTNREDVYLHPTVTSMSNATYGRTKKSRRGWKWACSSCEEGHWKSLHKHRRGQKHFCACLKDPREAHDNCEKCRGLEAELNRGAEEALSTQENHVPE